MSSYVDTFYPVINAKEHQISPGTTTNIDLNMEGIPRDAFEVTLYVKVRTGTNNGQDEPGEIVVRSIIPNGPIERRIFCYFYGQNAWSYNSENISLPVGSEIRVITASLEAARAGKKFSATAKVVSYKRQPARSKDVPALSC